MIKVRKYVVLSEDAPIYPTHSVSMISAILVQQGKHVCKLLQSCNINGSGPFALSGRVTLKQLKHFIEGAVTISTEAGDGLLAGRSVSYGGLGVYGLGMRGCQSHHDFCLFAERYQLLIGPLAEGWHEVDDDRVTWFFFPILALDKESSEYQLSLEFQIVATFAIFRELFGSKFRLRQVTFRFDAPAHAKLYEDIFDCDVLFGQLNNSFSYHAGLCSHKDNAAQALIMPQIIDYCEHALSKTLINGDIKKKIQLILLAQSGTFPDIESISAMLSMHSRTLRRRLKLAHTSYRKILLEIRRDRALEYLQETYLTYLEIATRLGFSDVSSFRKAFQKWTGRPPSYYRDPIRWQEELKELE